MPLSSLAVRIWLLALLSLLMVPLLVGEDAAADGMDTVAEEHPVASTLELQIELHRRGFSCGSIDGVAGAQTTGALRAFQRGAGIADTGVLDAPTRELLHLTAPALGEHEFSPAELGALHAVPDTWQGKSEVDAMAYATPLELAAEMYHAHPALIRQLNPTVNWSNVLPGTKIVVPAVHHVVVDATAAQIVITLSSHQLEVFDANSRIIAHFPVSIARMVEKRPVGELHVTVVIPDPDYTFDPAVFPESPEAKALGHKLIIPPGPNNPVGRAWIGLDRQGYGIHGTPDPEKVGRTESHGCFRLANWDAVTLLGLVHVGMPVIVEP
jgi:lipoprotein-anchoring transpeptidase ErfK/SrfK